MSKSALPQNNQPQAVTNGTSEIQEESAAPHAAPPTPPSPAQKFGPSRRGPLRVITQTIENRNQTETVNEQPQQFDSFLTELSEAPFDAFLAGPKSEYAVRLMSYINGAIDASGLKERYNFVLFHINSPYSIDDVFAERVLSDLESYYGNKDKEILVYLHSEGGDIAAAYNFARWVKNYSKGERFSVAIPTLAKSAATLIALGANEIHMGLRSQLGPIDPQKYNPPTRSFSPLLGMNEILKFMASQIDVTDEGKALMFAHFLANSLDPLTLGASIRIPWAACQYAMKLLESRGVKTTEAAHIAKKLVYFYEDHGFVIDHVEAAATLGANVVKFNSAEHALGLNIYRLVIEASSALSFGRESNDLTEIIVNLSGTPHQPIWFYTRPDK